MHIGVNCTSRYATRRKTLRGPTACQRLHDIHVIYALVEAAVSVTPVVCQLMGVIQQQFLRFASGSHCRIALGVNILEHGPKRLADSQWRAAF